MSNPVAKILFFIAEDWFVCSHWLPLIRGAKNAGYDVVVVTNVQKHGHEIMQLGVKVIPLNIARRSVNPLAALITIKALISIYLSERPTLSHHVALKPMLLGSIAAMVARVPHRINWVAGMGWLFIANGLKAAILQKTVKKLLSVFLVPSRVIVENVDDQSIMLGLGIKPADISIVRGAGVDTRTFSPKVPPLSPIKIVLPARMLWDKGVSEFVSAARCLKSDGVNALFILVGGCDNGNPASIPEIQLKSWEQDGIVEWWGRREDMPQVLQAAHIVCLPSYREGLPKALLEAASCGKPIVTTDVPGCREVVQHGYNGLLVAARDSEGLAHAMRQLITSESMRERMGKAGRELVLQEFSEEHIVDNVLKIYKHLLNA